MALLNEINVKGVPHPIVTDDGYYQEMTVGDAEQLVATTFTEDDAPYNFRTAGGAIDIGDRKQVEGLVGGSIVWNQLVRNVVTATNAGITLTANEDGSITISGTATARNSITIINVNTGSKNLSYGHVYYLRGCPDGGSMSTYYSGVAGIATDVGNGGIFKHIYDWTSSQMRFDFAEGVTLNNLKVYPQYIDLTQMFGSTIANYIHSLEQGQAGAGVAWFKKLFPKPYYAYNAGELMSVKALRHKTVGFNQCTENWRQGDWNSTTTTSRVSIVDTDRPRLIGGMSYCLNCDNSNYMLSGAFLEDIDSTSFFTTVGFARSRVFTAPKDCYLAIVVAKSDNVSNITPTEIVNNCKITLNLHWDGERDGDYEEYSEHIYELDPDLELRGIPKLSAGNDLYYDGDIYEPDGTVTRKYGIVDLGTLNWAAGNNYFEATAVQDAMPLQSQWATQNGVCGIYGVQPMFYVINNDSGINKSIAWYSGTLRVRDIAYSTAEQFKAAVSGVYLVYELATPTTEEADPYNGTQIVDDFGTEEFVDAGVEAGTRDVAIPVGHNSLYQPNLRAKLEMVPESPEDEGYYVVYHHDGINEYVPLIIPQELPELPTEDGTYTLKCTVASGSATLSFESEV